MNARRKAIIQKLLDKIQSGEIVVNGKLLPERQLVNIMSETRPVVREGLIALDAMGIIDIRDRQGMFLASDEENDMRKMIREIRIWPADVFSRVMEVRQIIEPLATGLAAARRNNEDLKKMRYCLKFIKELASQTGEKADKDGAYWNTSFHTVIVESAANAYLSRIYEGISERIEYGIFQMRINSQPEAWGGRQVSYRDHVQLYEMIEAKDTVNAELFAMKHLEHTIKAMVKLGQISAVSDLFEQGFMTNYCHNETEEQS